MRGRRLWAEEDINLRQTHLTSSIALAALVNAVTDSIFFESDLQERWAAEALKWMLECNSRHLTCRSHQVHPTVLSHTSFCCLLLCHAEQYKGGLHPLLLWPDTKVEVIAFDVWRLKVLILQLSVCDDTCINRRQSLLHCCTQSLSFIWSAV